MEENKTLVERINTIMANEEVAENKQEELQRQFGTLERSDIAIRNEIKQIISKKRRADERIEELGKRKQEIIDEVVQIEEKKPAEQKKLQREQEKKKKLESSFEEMEIQVRDMTEKLRRKREQIDNKYIPIQNQF